MPRIAQSIQKDGPQKEAPVRRQRRFGALSAALAAKAFAAMLLGLAIGGSEALGDGLSPLQQPKKTVTADAARLEPTAQGGVALRLRLSGQVDTQAFELSGPDRVVVDFPEIHWNIDPAAIIAAAPPAVRARGVKGMRVGLFRMGRSRMVLDLEGPMRRAPVRFLADDGAEAGELVVELQPERPFVPAEPEPSRAGLSRRAAALAIETGALDPLASPRAGGSTAPAFAPAPRLRPRITVIAVDAGHGGHDKGAHHNGLKEKNLVLAVAKALRDELESHPRVRVVMTRESDRFVELDERVAIARDAGADLFVSLHADALKEHPEVSGASFYTLSDSASDALAARIARQENAALQAAPSFDVDNPWVRRLLVDYAQRRHVGSAHHLVEGMVRSFRSERVPLIRTRPHREAGFLVLKNFDQPSLLIELGFLTNIRDQRRFSNPAWRETAVKAISSAILRWIDDRDAPAVAGDLVMRADATER